MSQDSVAFAAANKDASSGIKAIEASCASLVNCLKQLQVCPAQCRDLVQICLEGTKKMKRTYSALSDTDKWRLFTSKKLRQLVSSLNKLLSTIWCIKDLLHACGSQWGSMGLVVSMPLPPPEKKTSSKFDVLVKELNWNLETIHYALYWNTWNMEFQWNGSKCRFVLETLDHGPGVTVAEADVQLEESARLASEDRSHLLSQLKEGSILTPKNFFLHFACPFFSYNSAADRLRDSFAEVLKKRLRSEVSVLSNESSSVPECFWINHGDLKLRSKLSGENDTKTIHKGLWCGLAVAIGITKYTTKAAIEREAILMLKVQHPNIVNFLGCGFTDDAPVRVSGGKDVKCTAGYLVMELMKEDLRKAINRLVKTRSGSPFPLDVALDILLQIAEAMIHMHSCNIMHRDLKAANCLVNPRSSSKSSSQVNFCTVKLIDFGISKTVDPDKSISNHTANSGTRRWMAPEVWGTQGVILAPYTRSADVWSFGMTCYEVISGELPFYECVVNSDLQVALHEGKRPVLPTSASCPEGLKELMSKCWAQEASTRPDFKTIRETLWTIKSELELQ